MVFDNSLVTCKMTATLINKATYNRALQLKDYQLHVRCNDNESQNQTYHLSSQYYQHIIIPVTTPS